jgi:hypothetical protein
MEIERLRQRLRDYGLDERDAPEPSPAPQHRADMSKAMAMLDQLDIVAQPENEVSDEPEAGLWTQHLQGMNAKVDRLLFWKELEDPVKSTLHLRPP